MKPLLPSTVALLTLFGTPSFAQPVQLPPRETVVKILMPLAVGEFGGVGGSLWKNELWIHNDNEVPLNVIRLRWVPAPCPPTCRGQVLDLVPQEPIAAHSTRQVGSTAGEFLYVDRSLAPHIYFQARTHDEARNSISAGTEIPVINETYARHRIELPSIPLAANCRYMLRVYTFGYDESVPASNRIRYFDGETGALLADTPLQFNGFELEGPKTYTPGPFPNEIPLNLSGDARFEGAKSLRIEIESPYYTFWAFLSVTNNLSHEVTVISPWPGA